MGLFITAVRQTEDRIDYAYVPSKLPSSEEEVIDGNNEDGILDGNQR